MQRTYDPLNTRSNIREIFAVLPVKRGQMKLIFLHGLPGVGKLTVARELSKLRASNSSTIT